MYYYSFNIGDYQTHTGHLTLIEDIAYRRMLDWLYLHEKPLPETPLAIARQIRMRDYVDEVTIVLEEFFEHEANGFTHPRVTVEVSKFLSTQKTNSKAGKASAKARAIKASERPFNDRSTTVQPTKNQEPRTNNHKPITSKSKDLPTKVADGLVDEFDTVWTAYPKKADKQAAIRAWKKLKPKPDLINQILKDVSERLRLGHWTTADKKYIPSLGPYLNNARWEDEIIPSEQVSNKNDAAEWGDFIDQSTNNIRRIQ